MLCRMQLGSVLASRDKVLLLRRITRLPSCSIDGLDMLFFLLASPPRSTSPPNIKEAVKDYWLSNISMHEVQHLATLV